MDSERAIADRLVAAINYFARSSDYPCLTKWKNEPAPASTKNIPMKKEKYASGDGKHTQLFGCPTNCAGQLHIICSKVLNPHTAKKALKPISTAINPLCRKTLC
jgi:hypothetical protein